MAGCMAGKPWGYGRRICFMSALLGSLGSPPCSLVLARFTLRHLDAGAGSQPAKQPTIPSK